MSKHIYTDHWVSQINEITHSYETAFGSLSEAELNLRPTADSWSIAQNMDHLMKTNESYFPIIANIRSNTYPLPMISKVGFMTTFFGNLIMSSVLADRKRKVKTFPIWEPSQSNIKGDIVPLFVAHQEQLKQLILNSTDLINQGTIISSPANKIIVYKLDKAYDILIEHERRHLVQSKEVLNDLLVAKS